MIYFRTFFFNSIILPSLEQLLMNGANDCKSTPLDPTKEKNVRVESKPDACLVLNRKPSTNLKISRGSGATCFEDAGCKNAIPNNPAKSYDDVSGTGTCVKGDGPYRKEKSVAVMFKKEWSCSG